MVEFHLVHVKLIDTLESILISAVIFLDFQQLMIVIYPCPGECKTLERRSTTVALKLIRYYADILQLRWKY